MAVQVRLEARAKEARDILAKADLSVPIRIRACYDLASILDRTSRYDEATPLIVGQIHERIEGSEWTLFEASSHLPHVEEPEAFLERVNAFLLTID